MRISISVSSSHATTDAQTGARHMIERAKAAGDVGLEALFIGDHHVTAFNYFQNNAILGRMLAGWSDKPYGALYLLPLWNPVLLAEQIGTLAALAPGRFIMQCGLGDQQQGDGMGIDMSKRVGLFESSLKVMRALWAGETVDEDKYWGLKGARINPVPLEPVEVWVGALVPKAIERAARVGDGWLAAPNLTHNQAGDASGRYQDACSKHSKSPSATAIRRDIFIGATTEEAKAVVQPYIDGGYRGINPEALMFGSPEDVAGQMRQFADMGYTDIVVRNISTDQNEALATIERLADVRALLD